jgi:hypothetical protein
MRRSEDFWGWISEAVEFDGHVVGGRIVGVVRMLLVDDKHRYSILLTFEGMRAKWTYSSYSFGWKMSFVMEQGNKEEFLQRSNSVVSAIKALLDSIYRG